MRYGTKYITFYEILIGVSSEHNEKVVNNIIYPVFYWWNLSITTEKLRFQKQS